MGRGVQFWCKERLLGLCRRFFWALTLAPGLAGSYLAQDANVVAWGSPFFGSTAIQTTVSNAVAISAGYLQALALRSDGTVTGWGGKSQNQSYLVPAGLSNVVAVAAGYGH